MSVKLWRTMKWLCCLLFVAFGASDMNKDGIETAQDLTFGDQCGTVYLDCDLVDANLSSSVVRIAPVSNYFDTLGGQYRFGILGDHVKSLFPELTMDIEKTYIKKDKSSRSIMLTVLDSNSVFMHSLAQLQAAMAQFESADIRLNGIATGIENFDLQLSKLIDVFTENLSAESVADIREKQYVAQQELDNVLDEINHITDVKVAVKNVAHHKLEARKSIILEANERLSQQLKFHFEALAKITKQKIEEINELLVRELSTQYEIDAKQLKNEVDVEINALKEQINTAIKAAQYRIQEETDMERKNEDVHVNILQAKEDSRRMASNEMITVLFQEIGKYSTILLDNPRSVLLWSSNLLVVVSIFIIVMEIIKESKNALLATLSPPFGLVFVKGKRSSLVNDEAATKLIPSSLDYYQFSGNSSYLKNIILAEETKLLIMRIAASLASQNPKKFMLSKLCPSFYQPSLPPVQSTLIQGPGGTGKSMVAVAIAEASGLPYAVICGADLEAHGSRASGYLRVVLDRLEARSNGDRCLLIIDDPEHIVDRRIKRNFDCDQADIASVVSGFDEGTLAMHSSWPCAEQDEGFGSTAIPYCLYVLLQAIRTNSNRFGLIITSSQDLSNIDSALLDRMDNLVRLKLPSHSQRLPLVLNSSRELLVNYVSGENRDKLLQVSEAELLDNYKLHNYQELDRSQNGNLVAKRKSVGKRVQLNNYVVNDVIENSSLNIVTCMTHLVKMSHGWSCREIRKVIQNIQSSVLGTESCELTMKIWQDEIAYWVEQRQKALINNT